MKETMKCKICGKDSGKKKTCSAECLTKLRSINGTRLNREGVNNHWNYRNR